MLTANLRRLLIIAIPCVVIAGCSDEESNPLAPVDAGYTEAVEHTIDAVGATRLVARTTNGAIDVVTVEGDSVRVLITTTVRAATEDEARDFAALVEIDAGRAAETVHIGCEYPRPPAGIEVEVTYWIRCPADLAEVLDTVNGALRIEGAGGHVDATTVNGDITFDGHGGPLALRSTNGRVRATVRELAEAARFSTTNGSLDVAVWRGMAPIELTVINGNSALSLPGGFCGRLDAATAAGAVYCDLALGGAHGRTTRHVWGELGEGCPVPVTLRAAVGRIDIARF